MEYIKIKSKLNRMKRYIQDHKFMSFLVAMFVLSFLVVVGYFVKLFVIGQVDVVPQDEVDPNASEVLIGQVDAKDDGVYNVLLIGTDSRDPDSDMGRSDSMMLVSYNSKENKATIVSFLRDTLVDIPGHGKSRLGHTYAYGGVGLTINTLNETFDLDVQDYITISFEDLVDIIDEMGGIEVPISEEEARYYRANGMTDIQDGTVNLSGSQALAHARNRTLGSDFERTRRQRSVMYGIYAKLMQEKDPEMILSLVNYCLSHVKTNMDVTEIYELAMEVLTAEHLLTQQASVPDEETYKHITYEGMSVLEFDVEANKQKMDELLY